MHDENSEGEAYFRCDFCHKPWAEDRPMVEGHQGSLICAPCLTMAFKAIALGKGDAQEQLNVTCALCLEGGREGAHWQSPAFPEIYACKRCVKQSAGILHKDPEHAWTKPTA